MFGRTKTVYTGEYTLCTVCIYTLCAYRIYTTHETFRSFYNQRLPCATYVSFIYGRATSNLSPQTHRRISPTFLPTHLKTANPFESELTGSRSFSHGAPTLSLTHIHMNTLPLYLSLCPPPPQCLKWGWKRIQIPQLNHTAKPLCNSDYFFSSPPRPDYKRWKQKSVTG